MSNPFSAPAAPGSGIDWSEMKGQLLLVEPESFEEGVKTAFGDNDAVRADVTVLSGDSAGEVYENTLIFPKLLVSQTKSKLGEKVLARLGQGEAKPGQSPPWLFQEASEDDQAAALRFIEQRSKTEVSQPAKAGADVPF